MSHPAPALIGLRSLCFNVLFYLNLIVLMILGLPAMLLGRHGVFFMARTWAYSSIWLLDKICGLKLEFRGLENMPQGGYILASKHQSFLETFSLVTANPRLRHHPEAATDPSCRSSAFISPSPGRSASIAPRGRSALQQIIEMAAQVLRSGRQVYIYPEGTRRSPGAEPQYKHGVAYLYEATGAPCLPVALNTGMYWGRRGFLRRPGTAVIEFLPVIPPGLPREVFFERLKSDIETASARLMEEAKATLRQGADGRARFASANAPLDPPRTAP